MKKLNTQEIQHFADYLCFSFSQAKDITDIFYNLKKENPINDWRVSLPLNNVDEYIREWENHWHREMNIQECYECDKEQCDYEDSEKYYENLEVFIDTFLNLSVFQLPNNDMVIEVC